MIRDLPLPQMPLGAPDQAVRLTDYYRALLQQLATKAGLTENSTCQALGITSCEQGEGVSTICANLAIVASQDLKKRVLLIDANLDQPQAVRTFELQDGPGLTDVLRNGTEVGDCIQPTRHNDLFVLPAGTPLAENANLPQSAIGQLMTDLRDQFGVILMDLPVANDLSGCFKLAATLDGVMLVVEAERVRNQVVRRAKEQLQQNKVKVLGVVFNKRRQHVPGWLYRRI